MSITVANRPLQDQGGLSERCRLALRFIDGGVEWFNWATLDPAAAYAFPDESEMLAEIQTGLHAHGFTLLRELKVMIGPAKLMTMSEAELRILARAELKEKDVKSAFHTHRLLQAHGILSQTDFDKGTAYLTELGVGGDPMFQFMSYEERKAIYDVFNDFVRQDDEDLDIEKEAAAFGVEQGRTPREFADYFRVYVGLTNKGGLAKTSERRRQAEAAVHALAPNLFGQLNCPEVDGLVHPKAVADAIESWLAWGNAVGFARLSAGVREVVLNTAYAGETGAAARDFVDQYVGGAQRLLSAARVHRGLMAQDGATCTFPIEHHSHEAEIQLDPQGIISLSAFALRPEPAPRAGRTAKQEDAS
ncbi:MAG: hypothetical protein ACK4Y4_05315 [Brevundimonas sp.]